MTSKRLTQRNRAIALAKIKVQLHTFYREDLIALRAALDDALQEAKPTPAVESLTAPGEWLEERTITRKTGKVHHYVYLRYIDQAGRERGNLVYRGTLAEYVALRTAV